MGKVGLRGLYVCDISASLPWLSMQLICRLNTKHKCKTKSSTISEGAHHSELGFGWTWEAASWAAQRGDLQPWAVEGASCMGMGYLLCDGKQRRCLFYLQLPWESNCCAESSGNVWLLPFFNCLHNLKAPVFPADDWMQKGGALKYWTSENTI